MRRNLYLSVIGNVIADALSRLLMLSHMRDSGISDDDPTATCAKSNFFSYHSSQMILPLTMNGVFDDLNVYATKEIQAPSPNPINSREIFDSSAACPTPPSSACLGLILTLHGGRRHRCLQLRLPRNDDVSRRRSAREYISSLVASMRTCISKALP